MLHTGFRISDTVKLERKRVDLETGKLLIRIMETRRPMHANLPATAIQALRALPDDSPYFFGRETQSSPLLLETRGNQSPAYAKWLASRTDTPTGSGTRSQSSC
jgi:integrase